MQDWLFNYFPDILQKKYEKEIKRHRLAREIVATTMANSLVNRMGPDLPKIPHEQNRRPRRNRKSLHHRPRRYGLRELWDTIEALDKVPAEVQLKAMKETVSLSEHAINWFLTLAATSISAKMAIASQRHHNLAKKSR